MGSPGGFSVNPATLDSSAERLIQLSGGLQAGRPDAAVVKRGTGSPFAHVDVAKAAGSFADFAADQYQDAVALLAALSSQLRRTSVSYRRTDEQVEELIRRYLQGSTLQRP